MRGKILPKTDGKTEVDDSFAELGMTWLNTQLTKVGDWRIVKNEDGTYSYQDFDSANKIDLISKTWENRPQTNLIKWLITESGKDVSIIANYLDCKKETLNNKITRGSFSIDDLVIVAYACGYSLALVKNGIDPGETVYVVDPVDYFSDYDEAVLERMQEEDDKERERRYKEFLQKKEELEKMKKMYGFED